MTDHVGGLFLNHIGLASVASTWFRRWRPARLLGSDIADLRQIALAELWKAARDWDGIPAEFPGYANMRMRRAIIDAHKRAYRRRQMPELRRLSRSMPSDILSPLDDAALSERAAIVRDALGCLPPIDAIVLMRRMSGERDKMIAADLCLSGYHEVKKIGNRARRRFADVVKSMHREFASSELEDLR